MLQPPRLRQCGRQHRNRPRAFRRSRLGDLRTGRTVLKPRVSWNFPTKPACGRLVHASTGVMAFCPFVCR